jgi:hypothetical protein
MSTRSSSNNKTTSRGKDNKNNTPIVPPLGKKRALESEGSQQQQKKAKAAATEQLTDQYRATGPTTKCIVVQITSEFATDLEIDQWTLPLDGNESPDVKKVQEFYAAYKNARHGSAEAWDAFLRVWADFNDDEKGKGGASSWLYSQERYSQRKGKPPVDSSIVGAVIEEICTFSLER